jgi:hypothetical protein
MITTDTMVLESQQRPETASMFTDRLRRLVEAICAGQKINLKVLTDIVEAT